MGTSCVNAMLVEYFLLAEETDACAESYGVEVSCSGGERASVRNLTFSQSRIDKLMSLLIRCRVTPVALRDVVEDWLLF